MSSTSAYLKALGELPFLYLPINLKIVLIQISITDHHIFVFKISDKKIICQLMGTNLNIGTDIFYYLSSNIGTAIHIFDIIWSG